MGTTTLSGTWIFVTVFLFCALYIQSVKLEGQCILGKHHKQIPSPENLTDTSCAAWSSNACCTAQTAVDLTKTTNASDGAWLNFRWDHCVDAKKPPLSPECRKRFALDLCFYECSPNTGPWIKEDRRKIRQNRFVDIPLCKTDCDGWFEACKDDWTCTDNWSKNFRWDGGVNICDANQPCRQFKDVYSSPQHFCETVFDHSFKYSAESQPCMKLSFDGSGGNPNNIVEQWKLDGPARIASYSNGGQSVTCSVPVLLLALPYLALFLWS